MLFKGCWQGREEKVFDIIKKENPGMVAVGCLEFADFYAFALTEKGRENEPIGGGYDTVNKVSGALGGFTPTQDFDAFFAAKEIPIGTLN